MRTLILYFVLLASLSAYSQNNNRYRIVDKTSHDQLFNISISGFETTLYLNFSTPIIPNFASIYTVCSVVRGWYKDKNGKRIDGIGIYYGGGDLTFYLHQKTDKDSYLDIEMESFEDFYIFESHKPNVKLNLDNKLMINKEKAEAIIDHQSYTVKGVNIDNQSLERKILLELDNTQNQNKSVDLSEIIMLELSLNKEEVAGLNGWTQIYVKLVESSTIEDKTNILLMVTNSGSCNTDAEYLLSLTISNLYIFDYSLYEVNNCNRYHHYLIGDTYYIFPTTYLSDINSKVDVREALGSYQRVNSKVEIITSWLDD